MRDTHRRGRVRAAVIVSALVFLPTTGVAATTALYSLGYGAQSSSMAGATLASGSDALNQFVNPANLSFIPKRLDFSVMYLRSDLHFNNALNDKNNERGFAGFPLADNNFFIPAFGVTYPLAGTNVTGGFQLYGVGGDATRFFLDDVAPPAGFGATQRFRANLALMNFGPALAYKVNDWLSLGATLQVTAARLKLDQPFGTFNPPTSLRFRFRFNMDDYGFDFAFGGRVSATLKPTSWLTLAIAYQTPRAFTLTGDTRLTFPTGVGLGVTQTQGTIPFTLPQQIDAGVAVMPMSGLTVEAGFSWIGWSAEDPFKRFTVRLDTPPKGFPRTLVAPIHWDDQYIYRLGVAYALASAFTLRAGYSYASNPVSAPGAFLTFPAYGFQTLTCGWTWQVTERWDISAMFGRSFHQSVATTVSQVDAFHDHATEQHDQYTAQLQFGWRF